MIKSLEAEHPDATTTDTEGLGVWVFASVLHAVFLWGRTNEDAVAAAFLDFGSRMQQADADLDRLLVEIERCQRLLRLHASSLDYDDVKEAALGFYRGLLRAEPKPNLMEQEFLKFAITTFVANATRLKQSGHIKL